MITIEDQQVDIACPLCRFLNPVTLKQVQAGDIVICRGCKRNIRLFDHFNTVRKALRSVRRVTRELEKQLDQIGTVTIRL